MHQRHVLHAPPLDGGFIPMARQDATLDFDTDRCDDHDTFDEGTHSPSSQQSLSSDDFRCALLSQIDLRSSTPKVDFEAFDRMVEEQKAARKVEQAARTQGWVSALQQDLVDHVHPELRLPGLISEALRYELSQLGNTASSTASDDWDSPATQASPSLSSPLMTPQQVNNLRRDVKSAYANMLNEVRRAVRSYPLPAKNGEQQLSVAQHRQNIANQGMQCFAGLLAYSDGVCSAMTDIRRHRAVRAAGPLNGDSYHPLTDTPSEGVQGAPRGTVVGHSGRLVPVSLSAQHGKNEKVAAIRRRGLVPHTPQQMRRASTPMFAPAPRRHLRPGMLGVTAIAVAGDQDAIRSRAN